MKVYMEFHALLKSLNSALTSVQCMWRGVEQKHNPLVSCSVFVYVNGAPAVACFCRVVDGWVNGGDVTLSKVPCDSRN